MVSIKKIGASPGELSQESYLFNDACNLVKLGISA